MGGDRNSSFDSEESSLEQDFSVRSRGSPVFSGDPICPKVGKSETGLGFEEFEKVSCPIYSKSEINRKRAHNIYMEVLRSYDELQNRAVSLEDAKCKILGDSDDVGLKTRMKCKARNGYSAIKARRINFVVFVVNALSVLESMEDETMKPHTQIVSRAFGSPFLSFKDDKPVVVVTHGDLLSLSDRVWVRAHLGELLGIHPKKQIFDIPESDDYATKLAILDILHYCLDHADKNLPFKDQFSSQTNVSYLLPFIFLLLTLLLWIGVFCPGHIRHTARTFSRPDAYCFQHSAKDSSSMPEHWYHAARDSSTESYDARLDWSKIRHVW